MNFKKSKKYYNTPINKKKKNKNKFKQKEEMDDLPIEKKGQLDFYTIYIASQYFETIDDHINLIFSSKRFELNMTKFFYNPLPLNETTREFFPNLRTLYIYSLKDYFFPYDERIKERRVCLYKKYDLFEDQKEIIEQWTGLKCGEVVFDSDKDNWAMETSIFVDKIVGKKQLIFLIEDEQMKKFGYFLATLIEEKYRIFQQTSSDSFVFILDSFSRMLYRPKKFKILDLRFGCLLPEKDEKILIDLGGNTIQLKKQSCGESICRDNLFYDFESWYLPLCDQNEFVAKRIIVIQMN